MMTRYKNNYSSVETIFSPERIQLSPISPNCLTVKKKKSSIRSPYKNINLFTIVVQWIGMRLHVEKIALVIILSYTLVTTIFQERSIFFFWCRNGIEEGLHHIHEGLNSNTTIYKYLYRMRHFRLSTGKIFTHYEKPKDTFHLTQLHKPS